KSRMIPIAEYSRDSLRALRAETRIKYDERSQGTLQLFRKQKQLDSTGGDIAVLKQYGVPYEVLDRDGCIGAEPALAGVREKFVGGMRLPQDETGDCHMFTQALAVEAAKLGVQFKFNTSIERLVADGGKITGVVTSAGLLQADVYVAALGSWSTRMLKPLDIAVPVYPVKGYSITVPVIGATRYSNLHLNTGHGTLGWTMACGSGRVLADLLSGRKPDIDVSELTVARYDHRFG